VEAVGGTVGPRAELRTGFSAAMKRNYIGLANTFHDSAIAIVNAQGEVVFAEATERYLQNKRAVNAPPDAFLRIDELIETHCDRDAELVLGYSWSDDCERHLRADMHLLDQIERAVRGDGGEIPEFASRPFGILRFIQRCQLNAITERGRTAEYAISQLEHHSPRRFVTRAYEHHLAHAATACLTSPFEEGVCAIVDGYGEGRAFACYEYRDGRIRALDAERKAGRGSLGLFYVLVCDMCGFGHMAGDEWKVMGLAAHGKPDEKLLRLFRAFLRVEGLDIEFCGGLRWLRVLKMMHAMRRSKSQSFLDAADIAYAGQAVYEEQLLALLNNLHARRISDNLILGGGCALNSSANGRILDATPFRNLHVFAAPGDDGNAIGAALLAFREDNPRVERRTKPQTPYLGSSVAADAVDRMLAFGRIPGLTHCDDPPARAAELLSKGRIIGWMQGRAEFGPRSLGNRSILADPRSAQVRGALSARVKFREAFRPFAPSILHEFGPAYFENYQESPYMERTLRFRSEVVEKVPAVVHVDGTGRLQTVKAEWNAPFHRLITRFRELTEVPLVSGHA
jgi:carbamoyltransferase